MPLGPVFNAELLTTARRPRYYVIRFLYGLIILFQIYLSYQQLSLATGNGQGTLRIRDMAEFGQGVFTSFAVVQAVVVVLLTPALVGGAIADERQRKTLHYLLTSQLTSVEIVVGKLAARLLQVGVLVALGLPVVSLIGLFGGVDFPLLLIVYAATLTTTYFLATASILVSVVSRRPREAISLIYVLELAWLVLPTTLIYWMPRWAQPWPTIAGWVNPILGLRGDHQPVLPAGSLVELSGRRLLGDGAATPLRDDLRGGGRDAAPAVVSQRRRAIPLGPRVRRVRPEAELAFPTPLRRRRDALEGDARRQDERP